jgi:hypothetical protein
VVAGIGNTGRTIIDQCNLIRYVFLKCRLNSTSGSSKANKTTQINTKTINVYTNETQNKNNSKYQ